MVFHYPLVGRRTPSAHRIQEKTERMSKNNQSIYTDSDSDDYLDDEAFFTVNGAAKRCNY